MGFDTPEPVAWSEYRKDGLIADTYFVSRRSELTPLPQTMRRFPAPDTLPVLFEAGGNGAVNNLLFGEGGVDSCHLLSHTVRIAALVFVQ